MATSRSLGTLTLDLIAKVGGFTAALSKAARDTDAHLSSIEKQFSNFGDSIKGILETIGVGYGIKELIDTIGESIKRMDELGKSAAKVGLPVEQFSQLAAAAMLSNVNVDELQSTLAKLSKSEGTATNPASLQAKVFKALGINIKDANGQLKSSTQIMDEFADKFSKLGTNSTTIAAGIALFGKNFQDMIPFLSQGSEGIDKAKQEAIDLGAVLTGPAAQAAAHFDDNLAQIKLAQQGITNQLDQALLPTLNEWTDDIVGLAKDHTKLQGIANTLSNTLHVLAAIAIEVGAGFKVIGAAAETVVIAVGNAARSISALYGAFSKQDFSLNPITNAKSSLAAWKDFFKQFDANNKAARDSVSDIWSTTTDSLHAALDSASKQIDEVGNSTAPISVATEGVVKLSEAVDKIATKGTTSKGLAAATRQIAALGAAAIKSGEDVNQVQSVIATAIQKLQHTVGNKQQMAALQNALNPASESQVAKQVAALQSLADAVDKVQEAANPQDKAYNQFADSIRHLDELGDAAIKAGNKVSIVQQLINKGVADAQQKLAQDLAAPMQAAKSYADALNEQLDARKQELAVQAASIGLGEKEAQNMQQLASVTAQGTKAISDFEKAYQDSVAKGHPNATPEQYNSELASLKNFWSSYYSITKDGQDAVTQAQSSWSNGVSSAIADFMDKMNDAAQQAKDFTNSIINGFSDAFVQWASGAESAKKAFGDFIDSLFADALRWVANKALQEMLDALQHGSSASGGGSSTAGTAGSGAGFWASLIGAFASSGKASGGTVQAGMMYPVNENRPELLTVGGKDYLMMGAQNGRVDNRGTSAIAAGAPSITNIFVQPTTSRRSADQIATANERKQQKATSRNR